MPKLQPGSGVSDALLTLVGKIAIQWSYVDFLVREILSGLKDLDENSRGDIRGAYLRGKNGKTNEAINLAKEKITDAADKQHLIEWLAQVDSLAEDRNLVQHGIIVYKDPGGHTEPKFFVFRGKYKKLEQDFTKERLADLLKEISDLSANLLSICRKYGYVEIALLKQL